MTTSRTFSAGAIIATTAVCTYIGTAYVTPSLAQQGTRSGAPGRSTPAAQPSNSQPPANREPSAAPPAQQQPGTQGTQNPQGQNQQGQNQPGQSPQNPSQVNPADVNNNNNPNGTFTGSNNGFTGTAQGGINPNQQQGVNPQGQPLTQAQRLAQLRAERPFTFASPQAEARFNQSVQRLTALETRMNTANQNLLKRLGEVRSMSPDRQNGAMAEIVQQMLLDQAEVQKYLVQARSIWTGNLEGLESFGDEGLAGGPGVNAGGDAAGSPGGAAAGNAGDSVGGTPAGGTGTQPTNTQPSGTAPTNTNPPR